VSLKAVLTLAVFLLPATAWCQDDKSALSAKELYLQEDDIQPAKTPKKPTPPKKSSTQPTNQPAPNQNSAAATITPVVQHLGLRYNLVLVDGKSHKYVSADRLFRGGECVQLEFAPNHSGYLYVFLQGTSGKWQVLFPSSQMSEEVNTVNGRENVRIPANYCFKIEPPVGTEHLFVVLSRKEEDIDSLNRAVRAKTKSQPETPAPHSDSPAAGIIAENRLDAEIDRMRAELGSRDMSIQKVAEPDRSGEPENSVYIVNASNVSSDRLVTEILLKHD